MEANGSDVVGARSATFYIAVELSRSSWLAAVLRLGAQWPSRHKLKAGDVDGLLALIGRTRGTATRVCSLGGLLRVTTNGRASLLGLFWVCSAF
jgi:hypothetical protein